MVVGNATTLRDHKPVFGASKPGVVGSIPASPTIKINHLRECLTCRK